MTWPWTSRNALNTAEAEIRQLRQENATLQAVASERLIALRESHDERKVLLDRIVQLSGQPAIFHPAAPTPAASIPAPDHQEIVDGPPIRPTFDDVKREVRKAIKSGTLGLLSGGRQ